MEIKPDPCPFCKSEEITVNSCLLRVKCKKCGATGPMFSRYWKDGVTEREAAIMAWNDRKG